MTFGNRVTQAQQEFGPVVFGIDPHQQLLSDWGLPDSIDGLKQFSAIAVEAFAGHVGFVKPQSAFYERFGSAGIKVLEDAIGQLRAARTVVILDVKRGDIGSTMAAYAQAYLDPQSPLFVDAITTSPYLGFDSLQPAFELATRNDCGVFVLALTSNPEGIEVQRAKNNDRSVANNVLDSLKRLNTNTESLGSFGAVVGATITIDDENLDINGPILVPGVGTQGGTAESVRAIFGENAKGILPSVSRSVLAAGPHVTTLRDAARNTNANKWPLPFRG